MKQFAVAGKRATAIGRVCQSDDRVQEGDEEYDQDYDAEERTAKTHRKQKWKNDLSSYGNESRSTDDGTE